MSFARAAIQNVLDEIDLPQIGFLGTFVTLPVNTQLFLTFFTHGGTTQISEAIMAYEMAVAQVDAYVTPLRKFVSVHWPLRRARAAVGLGLGAGDIGDMLLVVSPTPPSATPRPGGSVSLDPCAT